MLDSRPRGWGFEPHQRHCIVSLSKNINPSLKLVQPTKTCPYITERLLMGHKESIKQILIQHDISLFYIALLFAIIFSTFYPFHLSLKSILYIYSQYCLFSTSSLTFHAYFFFNEPVRYGPHCDKTCLWDFRQSETQNSLLSFRD